jgi:DNA repair protein SbcD/Mre11
VKSEGIRIIHCADLHIGFRYKGMGDLAAKRTGELLRAFDRICELCKETCTDILLISGDLFDTIHVEKELVLHVIERLETIPKTTVVISPGNHDPLCFDSPYRVYKFPSNTLIFSEQFTYSVLEEKNVCLWGAGFGSSYENQTKLIIDEKVPFKDMIHICVMHGDLVSSGQKSDYNPINKEALRETPYDYLALGHVHKRSDIIREGHTFYAYSGCPEGHGFDEPDEQGIYMGTIGKGVHTLKFFRISSRCYRFESIDISACKSRQSISGKIIKTLSDKYPNDYRNDLFRIMLKGEVPEDYYLNLRSIGEDVEKDLFYAEIYDETTRLTDLDVLADEQSMKGFFIRELIELIHLAEKDQNEEEVSKLRKAIRYGLKAFDGEVISDADYSDLH